ncbi:MAG: hypothetical protein OEZ24_01905 [Candidatus Bathyarchaeota archaeon]|nr:hypothetical protein [Candidatus Bathyarchaeota archaeon]
MTSLHSSIKDWYTLPGDRLEVKVGNFIIDIVRDDLLIEIQTQNFSSIKKKMQSLVADHRVRLVYPIPEKKWIVRVAESNDDVISRRKSPKGGRLVDLFDELVWMPLLVREPSFAMEVLMIEEEEIRCEDGRGSWRRKGASIKDRKLLNVVERVRLSESVDFLRFLPRDLDLPFSNKSLAEAAGLSIARARRMTYCLRKMGAIRKVGKNRNELLFERACS